MASLLYCIFWCIDLLEKVVRDTETLETANIPEILNFFCPTFTNKPLCRLVKRKGDRKVLYLLEFHYLTL